MKAKRVGAIALLLALVLSLAGCGKSVEKRLVGSWYEEGRHNPTLVLYDDGTCEMRGEYGTGHWNIVNKDQLKLTNFYGETNVFSIGSVKNGQLILEYPNGSELQLWNEPKQ